MMDTFKGDLYPTTEAALFAGVVDPVELRGSTEAMERISAAVKAQHRAKNKAQKIARRNGRK